MTGTATVTFLTRPTARRWARLGSVPGTGSGHLWPLLDGERGEQDLQAGDVHGASGLALAMQRMSWGVGLVPEQVWEDPDTPASPYGSDPATESIGFTNGKAAGSATPLIWAQAQYLRLLRDLQTGKLLDQPADTRARYLNGAPTEVPVTITFPAPGATVSGATTVTGTTSPGATVEVASRSAGVDDERHLGGVDRRRRGWHVQGDRPDGLAADRGHGGGNRGRARFGLGPGDRNRSVERRARLTSVGPERLVHPRLT